MAFVEGITPTIHTRPTDSRSMMIFPAASRAYLHVDDRAARVFAVATIARLLSSSIVHVDPHGSQRPSLDRQVDVAPISSFSSLSFLLRRYCHHGFDSVLGV